jgi:hypothetical protein
MLTSVPFELFGSHMSPSAKGILRIESDTLAMDFRKRSPRLWIQTPPQEIRIPLKHVDAIEFETAWFLFHVLLLLRVRKMEYFVSVPTANGAEVILWCKRRHKAAAQDFANAITFQLLERTFVEDDAENRLRV